MRTSTLLACCLGAAALAACSPFDPDLGVTPYLCATSAPRCPEDYTCMDDVGGRSVCVQNGATPPDAGPDAPSGFQCAMDGVLEPNDTIEEAFQTDVGTGAPARAFGPISVCPEGDRDNYQINLITPLRGIEVITRWDAGMPVSSALLNEAGTAIANGTAMGQRALRACAANLPAGVYFAVAFSATNVKNNYRVEMRIVDNCAQ